MGTSLRTNLLIAIFVALLISFSAGTGLSVWEAARSVRAEQAASLLNARLSTAAAIAGLPASASTQAGLRRIVGAFNGSRHVQASLLGRDGSVLTASSPAACASTPAWLLRLITPSLKPVAFEMPGQGGDLRLLLYSAPLNEAAERWTELRARLFGFALFFALAAVSCSLTTARGLYPLTSLAQAMQRVGRGEIPPALPETGAIETATLARAFNSMAAALHAARQQNRQLTRQVATIAEEERAEIARDLHDEVGPLLFAITAYTAAIGRQIDGGYLARVPEHLSSIQQAVLGLQDLVRDMLGRLTPADMGPADLAGSLAALLAFWRGVRPETHFALAVTLPANRLTPPARECLFRATQEGISNAVRHGNPRHISVSAGLDRAALVLAIADDGAAGPEGPGRGLAGMRARVHALAGTVHIDRGAGWTVTVRLPIAPGDTACHAEQARHAGAEGHCG